VPDAAERIGADHVAVLEEAVRAAELRGGRPGSRLAQAALREVGPAAEPVRAALLLRLRGYLKYHLGRSDFAGDWKKRSAWCRGTAEPARGPGARSAGPITPMKVQRGWDSPEFLAAAEEAVTARGRPVTPPPKPRRLSPWPARAAGENLEADPAMLARPG